METGPIMKGEITMNINIKPEHVLSALGIVFTLGGTVVGTMSKKYDLEKTAHMAAELLKKESSDQNN
jgi:hypothetical protein